MRKLSTLILILTTFLIFHSCEMQDTRPEEDSQGNFHIQIKLPEVQNFSSSSDARMLLQETQVVEVLVYPDVPLDPIGVLMPPSEDQVSSLIRMNPLAHIIQLNADQLSVGATADFSLLPGLWKVAVGSFTTAEPNWGNPSLPGYTGPVSYSIQSYSIQIDQNYNETIVLAPNLYQNGNWETGIIDLSGISSGQEQSIDHNPETLIIVASGFQAGENSLAFSMDTPLSTELVNLQFYNGEGQGITLINNDDGYLVYNAGSSDDWLVITARLTSPLPEGASLIMEVSPQQPSPGSADPANLVGAIQLSSTPALASIDYTLEGMILEDVNRYEVIIVPMANALTTTEAPLETEVSPLRELYGSTVVDELNMSGNVLNVTGLDEGSYQIIIGAFETTAAPNWGAQDIDQGPQSYIIQNDRLLSPGVNTSAVQLMPNIYYFMGKSTPLNIRTTPATQYSTQDNTAEDLVIALEPNFDPPGSDWEAWLLYDMGADVFVNNMVTIRIYDNEGNELTLGSSLEHPNRENSYFPVTIPITATAVYICVRANSDLLNLERLEFNPDNAYSSTWTNNWINLNLSIAGGTGGIDLTVQ